MGLFFINLSEKFDHNPLIPKLEAYGFSYSFLKYLKSYLDNWQQGVNTNNNFSSCKKRSHEGLPKDSILGPLLLVYF